MIYHLFNWISQWIWREISVYNKDHSNWCSLKFFLIVGSSDLFHVAMQTQAGTYVKEFIHGDFGRTSPCLSSLVGADVDIFRLDVIDIDLDWPKKINSVPHPALNILNNCSNLIIDNDKSNDEQLLEENMEQNWSIWIWLPTWKKNVNCVQDIISFNDFYDNKTKYFMSIKSLLQ